MFTDVYDDRRCAECQHAKYKETFESGFKLYICNKHRAAITGFTLAQSVIGCKGKDYEQRQAR